MRRGGGEAEARLRQWRRGLASRFHHRHTGCPHTTCLLRSTGGFLHQVSVPWPYRTMSTVNDRFIQRTVYTDDVAGLRRTPRLHTAVACRRTSAAKSKQFIKQGASENKSWTENGVGWTGRDHGNDPTLERENIRSLCSLRMKVTPTSVYKVCLLNHWRFSDQCQG